METWTKKVKTRKPHKCWGCGYEFKPGTEMEYITNIDGGQFVHSYWCTVCQKVANGLDSWEKEDGFGFCDIKENYPDEWGVAYSKLGCPPEKGE